MSNRRVTGATGYKSDFLRSRAWFARRNRWFRTEQRRGRALVCGVCGGAASISELELHHLDYAGVSLVTGKWRALEKHDDLMPMHPACHDLVHRLIDRDTVLSRQRSRRDATAIAAERIRAALSDKELI
jgi:hypothetical protein